jgi:tripartite-type tricarboxylate transporter receptor subunit TctC
LASAGGGTDVIARILADRLRGPYASTGAGRNAGAAARIAVEYVKNAEADGSVMLFTPDFRSRSPAQLPVAQLRPLRDFTCSASGEVDADLQCRPGVPESA